MLVGLEEVCLFRFDRPGVKTDLVLLASAGLGTLAEGAQHLATILLRDSFRSRVLMLLERFQQVAIRALQEDKEEKVLSEANRTVAVRVHLLQNIRLMFLKILVSILEVRRVAVWSHRMQEVLVAHSQFAFLGLLTGKDFERLLGRRKEPDLVLVVPADLFGPRSVVALIFLSLFGIV